MVSNNSSGFTLIELLVTVAIIGILAAIAIPQYASYRVRSYDSRSVSDLRSAAIAEEAYFADHNHYVDCVGTTTCLSVLPIFSSSNGVTIDMFDVPETPVAPEHFTGRAYHPLGERNNAATAWMWNSNQGGLQ